MLRWRYSSRNRNGWLGRLALIAGLLLATGLSSGCLLALAGAGAGAGLAYAHHKGKETAFYACDFNNAWYAVRESLADLGLPITDERRMGLQGTIESRTGEGKRIVVKLRSFAAPIPTDGFRTEVVIRVGTFGNAAISDHILGQIAMRLDRPPTVAVPPSSMPRYLPPETVPALPEEQLPHQPRPTTPPPRPIEPDPLPPE